MKFFDCDVMIGPTIVPIPNDGTGASSSKDALPDARTLLTVMDRLRIERTLFFHYSFTMDQKRDMNHLTMADAKQSERLVPTWVLATTLTRMGEKLEDQIERMLDSGVKAARFFVDEGPQGGPLSLKVYRLEGLYARMNQHRIPLLIPDDYLNGIGTPSSPRPRACYDDIEDICRNFPDLPVVLLQPSYASQQVVLTLAQRHKNFYFSIPIYGLFRIMENTAALIGVDRLLFGTAMPVQDPSLGLGMVLYAELNDNDKQLIAAGNLTRLLEAVR